MDRADNQRERQELRHGRGGGRDLARLKAPPHDLIAVFAHEIRTPLSVIANGLHILSHDYRSDGRMEDVRQTMARQIEHIDSLVDTLVDCSSVFGGDVRLRKKRIELAGIVLRALEQVRPQLERAGHRLSLDLPVEPLVLEADPVRLVQVLSNILENAVKYTPPGGLIELAASLDGRRLRVSVRDNGDGIAEDALPRLFEPFYRAPEARRRNIHGTGLGLALVHGLVDAHGGSVDVRSGGPGQGTEVVVWVPVG